MPVETSRFYEQNATKIFAQYQSLKPAEIYEKSRAFFPMEKGLVLDIGSGSGRGEIEWLALQGHTVVAVEPARELRELAMARLGEASHSFRCTTP